MYDFVDKFKKLSDKQQMALSLILIGENNKNVASKVGVDENTIYRWRNSEPFKSILIELRLQEIESLEFKISNLGAKALNKLAYLLENADSQNNQLKASTFIVDKILQLNELEIIKRLDDIEEKLINEKN